MEIVLNRIIFNSDDINFWKELRVKSNTVRRIPVEEVNEYNLQVMPDGRLYYGLTIDLITEISIRRKLDYTTVFTRELKDVTMYNGLYIFSWG
jgi:hypothetical protein